MASLSRCATTPSSFTRSCNALKRLFGVDAGAPQGAVCLGEVVADLAEVGVVAGERPFCQLAQEVPGFDVGEQLGEPPVLVVIGGVQARQDDLLQGRMGEPVWSGPDRLPSETRPAVAERVLHQLRQQ